MKRTCCAAVIWSYWLAYDLGSFPIETARPWIERCCSCEFRIQCAGHLCFLSTGGMILPCPAVLLFRQRLLQCFHLICAISQCVKSAGCWNTHDSCVYAWWYRIWLERGCSSVDSGWSQWHLSSSYSGSSRRRRDSPWRRLKRVCSRLIQKNAHSSKFQLTEGTAGIILQSAFCCS